MTNHKFDIYKETETLINLLAEVGENATAEELHNAMRSGATGTEVLMALKFYLHKLVGSGLSNDLIIKRAKNIEGVISKLLQ